MSQSGLSSRHCADATNLSLQAAVLGLHHSSQVNYTQDSRRWEGIARRLKAWRGDFPRWADCSSYVTWCLWCGLSHFDRPGHRFPDIVNGAGWQGGYTGTLLQHGRGVRAPFPGCAIIYGPGTGEHTALYTGGGLVVSHGGPGVHLLPWRYRSDVHSIRSYIY